MAENPYQAPAAELARPAAPVAAGGTFDIELSLSQAWRATWSQLGVWLPAGLVAGLVGIVAAITVIGYVVVVPVLAWGGVLLCLNLIDGRAQFGDVFAGFSRFGTALGRMLLLTLIFILLAVPGYALTLAGGFLDSAALSGLGSLVSLLLSVTVALRLYFAAFLIVDRNLPAMEALRTSWEVTRGKALRLFLLGLLSFVIILAGLLALLVGVIPASTIAYLMFASAYRQVVPRTA